MPQVRRLAMQLGMQMPTEKAAFLSLIAQLEELARQGWGREALQMAVQLPEDHEGAMRVVECLKNVIGPFLCGS